MTLPKNPKSPRVSLRFDVVACKIIRLLSFLGGAFFLLILPWFHGVTGVREQLVTETVVYTAFLFFFGLALIHSRLIPPLKTTAIDHGFFLALLILMVCTVTSVLPAYSLMTVVRFGAVAAFYALIRAFYRTEGARRLLFGVILTAGIFYCIYGLLQLKGFFPKDYWYESSSLASRYVNSGHFAGFLVMPFFAALIFLVSARCLASRFLFLCLLLFMSVVIVLTKSRTVWVSLFFGSILFLFLIHHIKPLPRRFFVFFAVGSAGLFSAALFFGLWSEVQSRFSELQTLHYFSIVHRFHFWQGALMAIAARPWGWGPGTFVHIFPHFRVQADRFIVDYAHNEALQLGVDLGVLGMALFLFLLISYGRIAWRSLGSAELDSKNKIQMAGLTACVLTLTLASQFDFPLRIYATAFFAAALLAIQAGLMEAVHLDTGGGIFKSSMMSWVLQHKKQVGILFALVGLLLSAFYLRAETHYEKGAKFEKDFEWDLAMKQYQLSRRYAPWASEYDEAGGRLAEKRAALMMNSKDRHHWLDAALGFYLSATQKNGYWPASFYKTGFLSDQLGKKQQAEKYLRLAHEKEPKNPLFTFAYGLNQLEAGRLDEGISLLEDFVKGGYYDPVPLTQTQILEKIYLYVTNAEQLSRVVFEGAFAQFDFGIFLIQKGHKREGLSSLREAGRLIRHQFGYPYYIEHFGVLEAQAYSQAGMYREAASIYEEAMKQSPHPEAYQGYLTAVLKKLGNH